MRITTKQLAALAVAAALPATGAPAAAAAAGPPPVTVDLISATGDGCGDSPGTQKPSVGNLPTGDGIFLRYAGLVASYPGPDEWRNRNCSAILRFTYPPGTTLAVQRSRFVGYVAAQGTSEAAFVANFRFAGGAPQSTARKKFRETVQETWELAHANQNVVFAPCGGTVDLLVDQTVSVTGSGDAKAIVSMNYAEHRAQTDLYLETKNC